MVQAIIFDFFGVLSLRARRLFFETYIPNYHERQAEFEDLTKQRNLGLISAQDYVQRIADETGVSPQECMQQMEGERRLNQPLIDYIAQHLRSHYKIGLLSNAGDELFEYIDPHLAKNLFHEIIISADVGLIKPDPAIFRLAAERLEVEPSETIMVDDLRDNCLGAESAGLSAIHYRAFQQFKPELERLLR